MGTWGAGIFQDDVAADVRGDWREAVLDGLEPAAATARVLDRHRDAREDDEDGRKVVATGVRRRDAGIERSPRRISTSWRNTAAALGSERFRCRIESALQGRPEAG